MRTPPSVRTWGVLPAEIIIRQSELITVDEFESVAWRGMELIDGWLQPKGAGLSNEEKALDKELRPRLENDLKTRLTERVDYLPVTSATNIRTTEIGCVVCPASQTYYEHQENLERWFALGYQEIWDFNAYHQVLTVYTSIDSGKRIKDAIFRSRFFDDWELPLAELFKD